MTTTRKTISIITVTLNSAKYVRHAVDSVVNQADELIQYIVIDGKSTDDTVAIVESYRAVLGSRLIVVSEKDTGLFDAMNKGLSLTTGDIIGILNSDDRYLPGTFSVVRSAFQSENAQIIYGDIDITDTGRAELFKTTHSGMLDRMSLGHPGCFVHRAVYSKWGHFNTRYKIAADYDFLLRCYLGGARFAHVNHVVAQFEAGGASSRSLELAREVYDIQLRQLGRPHALKCLIKRLASICFLNARRRLGISILGRTRYERIRNRWRARDRAV